MSFHRPIPTNSTGDEGTHHRTEQKGKWKPQKEDQFDDENINTTDDTDDVTTPYVSGDTDMEKQRRQAPAPPLRR